MLHQIVETELFDITAPPHEYVIDAFAEAITSFIVKTIDNFDVRILLTLLSPHDAVLRSKGFEFVGHLTIDRVRNCYEVEASLLSKSGNIIYTPLRSKDFNEVERYLSNLDSLLAAV